MEGLMDAKIIIMAIPQMKMKMMKKIWIVMKKRKSSIIEARRKRKKKTGLKEVFIEYSFVPTIEKGYVGFQSLKEVDKAEVYMNELHLSTLRLNLYCIF
jgi:hypothetical protein